MPVGRFFWDSWYHYALVDEMFGYNDEPHVCDDCRKPPAVPLSIGTDVRVNAPASPFHGLVGKIVVKGLVKGYEVFFVAFPGKAIEYPFARTSLELVQPQKTQAEIQAESIVAACIASSGG